MKLSDIGEKRIIETIVDNIDECKNLVSEIGKEDCALINYSNKKIVYTTDTLIRQKHFPRETSYEDIGWKTIAVNVSDIAAMGGKPLFSNTSMALPDINKKELEKITEGMRRCSEKFDLCQVGGDISEHEQIVLNTSIIGEVEKNTLFRKNAKPGQIVAVTGGVGLAGLGLKILNKELDIKDSLRKKALKKLYCPVPRVSQARKLSKFRNIAAIDISDGLSLSLEQLGEASNCGFEISTKKLPLSKKITEIVEKIDCSIFDLIDSGGDYELLFTTRNRELVENINATAIGRVTEKKGILYDGEKRQARGYSHF